MGATEHEATIDCLCEEAQHTALVPLNGLKPPKNIIDVLLHSKHFGVTNEVDTVYSVLGMCSIPAQRITMEPAEDSTRNAVVVDYAKSAADVYLDTAIFLLNEREHPEFFEAMRRRHKKRPCHAHGLPNWALDWRACRDDD